MSYFTNFLRVFIVQAEWLIDSHLSLDGWNKSKHSDWKQDWNDISSTYDALTNILYAIMYLFFMADDQF